MSKCSACTQTMDFGKNKRNTETTVITLKEKSFLGQEIENKALEILQKRNKVLGIIVIISTFIFIQQIVRLLF